MRKLSIMLGSLGAAALAGILVACDNPSSNNPLRPSVPGVSALELTGPDTLAPGQSAQYSVMIRLADGTRKAAGPGTTVRWNFNSAFLRVDASGLATAQQRVGDTTLRAMVDGSTTFSTKEITIVPEGTFRVVGRVVDAEFPSTPVPFAVVSATPGGLQATTDSTGLYRLYGVPPEVTIRASRAGYVSVEQILRLSAHATQDLHLPVAGERLALAGNYTLQIDTGGACAGGNLPTDLRLRRYEASLTQTGPSVEVRLTEPRFRVNSINRGNRFSGLISGSSATFTLEVFDSYYYPFYGPSFYPSVAEQLPNGNFFVPQGVVVTTGSSSHVSGQMLSGSFLSQWDSRFPAFAFFLGGCNSQSPIVFTLTSR